MKEQRMEVENKPKAQRAFWVTCFIEFDLTHGVLNPVGGFRPYDPMEKYHRGAKVYLEFAKLTKCADLGKSSRKRIERFVREYGLPGSRIPLEQFLNVGGNPFEPYPLDRFFLEAGELSGAIRLWKALRSRKSDKILAALDCLAVVQDALGQPQIPIYPRPRKEPIASHFDPERGFPAEYEDVTQQQIEETYGTPLEFGRMALYKAVNKHLKNVRLSLLYHKAKPRHLWFPIDLLSALWLMLALDILKDVRVWICDRCGDPYVPKRSTKLYCSRECAVAEAQGRPRKRTDEKSKPFASLLASLQAPRSRDEYIPHLPVKKPQPMKPKKGGK